MCRSSDANSSSYFGMVTGLLPPDVCHQVTQAHKHLQDVALWGVARERISILEGKGGRTDKGGWKEPSSGVLFGFNCFCSFSLALCTELEVWHFKVSFYRNKCQERWVISISLKINPSCQRNQNFALKLSRRESRSLPTHELCSCLR